MRRLLAVGLCVLLAGCGLSNPVLKSEIVSFDDVIENATDKLLVLNILRARDQAPLHFMALPSLRQSIQQNNQLSLLELTGPKNGSSQRSTATLGMSFQVAPTFDLNHVYSKEFVTGMTSAIDPKYVKYWIDRGMDRRLVMLLFFSSAEITRKGASGNPIRVTNTPKESIDEIRNRLRIPKANRCEEKSQFERYLSLINRFKSFSAKMMAPAPKLIGCIEYDGSNGSKFLQALAAAEQSKIKYKYVKSKTAANAGMYKLYAATEESQVLFCLDDKVFRVMKAGDQRTAPAEAGASCKESAKPAADDDDKDCPQKLAAEPKPPAKPAASVPVAALAGDYCGIFGNNDSEQSIEDLDIHFTIRSVGEMIHFLGDLLYYQEALNSDPTIRDSRKTAEQKLRHDLHDPVTLGYCRDNAPPSPEDARGIADILFNLDDGDSANARFTVPYRNRTYAVGNYLPATTPAGPDAKPCDKAYADRKDHTLEVLSVVQQLTNLHQSATEIRATPFVQVVP